MLISGLKGEYSDEITLGYLDRELKALRGVLYNALGERTWREVAQKALTQSALEQRFHTLGLGKWAIDVVSHQIPLSEGLNDAWAMAASIKPCVGDTVVKAIFRES